MNGKRKLEIAFPPRLTRAIRLAEKNQKKSFEDFSDVEMIQWFLYRKEHLDRQHDKSSRTIKEYNGSSRNL